VSEIGGKEEEEEEEEEREKWCCGILPREDSEMPSFLGSALPLRM
jgi:hypothetical protein